MKLSEMRQLLESRGIMLTKSLGQNFLHDENQLRRIVAAAELGPGDKVLEVGPGLGPLTEWLVMYAGEVVAVEIDARLAAFLRERFVAVKNLQIVQADGLRYVEDRSRDWSEWKLVANLPYSVGSPLMVELGRGGMGPSMMVATVQWEVAQRVAAKPDTDAYGLLTLLLQVDYEARVGFKIPSSCFFPEPGVESAVVILRKRLHPLLVGEARRLFVGLVKLAFSQRRKKMTKLLKGTWSEERVVPTLRRHGFPEDVRAEKLPLEVFVELARDLVALESGV